MAYLEYYPPDLKSIAWYAESKMALWGQIPLVELEGEGRRMVYRLGVFVER